MHKNKKKYWLLVNCSDATERIPTDRPLGHLSPVVTAPSITFTYTPLHSSCRSLHTYTHSDMISPLGWFVLVTGVWNGIQQ
jgi:hypothetical protein